MSHLNCSKRRLLLLSSTKNACSSHVYRHHQQRQVPVPLLLIQHHHQCPGFYIASRRTFSAATSSEERQPVVTVFTTSFPLQVSKTSGRRQKRLQRLKRQQQARRQRQNEVTTVGEKLHKYEDSDNNEDGEDHRTWKTILFPTFHDEEEDKKEKPVNWPKTPVAWAKILKEAWILYKGTWEGFFTNFETTKQKKGSDEEDKETSGELLVQNAKRNVLFSKEEGGKLFQEAQAKTGIYTMEDLKQFAREMMTVATKMLTEFMAEYRKGRDEEVEKMLHEYFQEEEDNNESDNGKDTNNGKRPKRRPKRRVPAMNE